MQLNRSKSQRRPTSSQKRRVQMGWGGVEEGAVQPSTHPANDLQVLQRHRDLPELKNHLRTIPTKPPQEK